MAFVPGFEFDIFISYSHLDDRPVEGKRWVERFHVRLRTKLFQRAGSEDIRIWSDEQIAGNQKFGRTLQSKLERSAILLCLNSRGYLNSGYCKKERDWFRDAHRNLLRIEDRSRIFNARLYNIPHTAWPDAFQGEIGFPFFHADGPEDEGSPLEPGDERFSDRLHRLAEALLTTLQEMRLREVRPSRPETVPTNEPRTTERRARLFFAKTSESLRKRKKWVIEELGKEFEVLEPVPPPFENPAHDAVAEERIRQADLSIHLLNDSPGEQIPGDVKCYPQRQAEIGRGVRVPQFIWVPRDLALGDASEPDDPEEKTYRSFLRELGAGSRGNPDSDFVKGVESEIVYEIRDRLERRKAPPKPSTTSQPTVLLDFHAKDEDYFYDVYQYLDDHGIQPKLNRTADDSRSNPDRFEKQLEQVSAFIVFFGQVARDWVLGRVLEAVKITAFRRDPVAFGIYLAPPRKPEGGLPDDWRPLTVHPMDNTSGFDPGSLAPLLAQLVGASTRTGHA